MGGGEGGGLFDMDCRLLNRHDGIKTGKDEFRG